MQTDDDREPVKPLAQPRRKPAVPGGQVSGVLKLAAWGTLTVWLLSLLGTLLAYMAAPRLQAGYSLWDVLGRSINVLLLFYVYVLFFVYLFPRSVCRLTVGNVVRCVLTGVLLYALMYLVQIGYSFLRGALSRAGAHPLELYGVSIWQPAVRCLVLWAGMHLVFMLLDHMRWLTRSPLALDARLWQRCALWGFSALLAALLVALYQQLNYWALMAAAQQTHPNPLLVQFWQALPLLPVGLLIYAWVASIRLPDVKKLYKPYMARGVLLAFGGVLCLHMMLWLLVELVWNFPDVLAEPVFNLLKVLFSAAGRVVVLVLALLLIWRLCAQVYGRGWRLYMLLVCFSPLLWTMYVVLSNEGLLDMIKAYGMGRNWLLSLSLPLFVWALELWVLRWLVMRGARVMLRMHPTAARQP